MNDGISGLLLFRPESVKWTLASAERIRLTNNDIERLARHALFWRRSSGVADSEARSRLAEGMCSIAATCQQANRNLPDFLTDCGAGRVDDFDTTSLLPAETDPGTG